MLPATLTDEQQKHLAKNAVYLLSSYKHISDSFIIEFFSEDLWGTLPISWQETLSKLKPPHIADLLLDKTVKDRKYESVWPLSLLAFRTVAHVLAFPRVPPDQAELHSTLGKPEEFHSNQSQSSLLGHIFRKHVKPKKQHEIRRLGMMVKSLCQLTSCDDVVDVGSGQGHLTRFLSFGLGLSVTAVEADANLVSMAKKFDGDLCWTLEKERRRKTNVGELPQAVPGPSPHHVVGWVNPKDSWEDFMGQLNRRDDEGGDGGGGGGGDDESERPAPVGGLCKKRPWISMSASDHRPASEACCLHPAECGSPGCRAAGGGGGGGGGGASVPQVTGHHSPLEALQVWDSLSDAAALTTTNTTTTDVHTHTQTLQVKQACRCNQEVCYTDSANSTLPRRISPPSDLTVTPGESVNAVDSGFVLTGLHACGDLSATLLRHFASCPSVRGITSVACCYMKITTKESPSPPGVFSPPSSSSLTPPPVPPSDSQLQPQPPPPRADFGYPMSEWVKGLPGHQLSYKAREGACHAIEDYVHRLREESELLKTHCYRAILETVIREERPDLRRAGIQTIKKAHMLPFAEYARLGLPRVGLPADLPLDAGRVEAMLKEQGRVVAYFSLVLLLAPVVETLVLLDRMLFLQERGIQSQLVPLFDPAFSPRNLVLVATKEAPNEEVQGC